MTEPHTTDDDGSGKRAAESEVGGHEGHEVLDPQGPCMACGAPDARIYGSADGPARLCPPCATLNGLGCP